MAEAGEAKGNPTSLGVRLPLLLFFPPPGGSRLRAPPDEGRGRRGGLYYDQAGLTIRSAGSDKVSYVYLAGVFEGECT